MAIIEPLTYDLVERALKKAGYHYLRDSDGDFNVRFSPTEKRNIGLSTWVILSGQNKTILELRAWTDKRYTRDDWGKCMTACNTWNQDKRWPKAYLAIRDNGEPASISLEWDCDAEKGLHVDLLEDWFDTFAVGADKFWEWALNERDM